MGADLGAFGAKGWDWEIKGMSFKIFEEPTLQKKVPRIWIAVPSPTAPKRNKTNPPLNAPTQLDSGRKKPPQYFDSNPILDYRIEQNPYNFRGTPAQIPTKMDSGGAVLNDTRPYVYMYIYIYIDIHLYIYIIYMYTLYIT